MKNKLKYIFLLLMLSASSVFPKTLNVCQNCEYKTIKSAVEVAEDGDTILVKPGVYKEANIKITKSISLIGEGMPTIDGDNIGEIITVGADNVTIDGFKIMNVGLSYTTEYAAVRVVKSNGFTIQNLEMEKIFFGIYLQRSSYGKVLNNKALGEAVTEFNSGNGIHMWHCEHVEVSGNDVRNVRDGIYLEFSSNITIKDNFTLGSVRYGLHFMFSNDNKVYNNIFETNGAGIALMFSRDMEVYNNIIRKNWGTASYGILLKEINDAQIRNNTFFENTVGITVEGSNRIEYSNNDFISNGYAIRMRGASYYSEVINNNFLYNSFDLSYNGRMNGNIFDGNYWSDYTGYDLNKDGVGDVPYRPVKLFSYIVNRNSEAIILLRSLFIDIIDFSEKVSPIFTPDELVDENPKMKRIDHDRS